MKDWHRGGSGPESLQDAENPDPVAEMKPVETQDESGNKSATELKPVELQESTTNDGDNCDHYKQKSFRTDGGDIPSRRQSMFVDI